MVNAEKEHRFWNALALLFFVSVCAISFTLILSRGDLEVERLGFFDLVLLGLATFRLIHLITYDRILDFARVAVMDSDGKRLKAAERGWRRVVCELMQCLWCRRRDGLFVGNARPARHSDFSASRLRLTVTNRLQSDCYGALKLLHTAQYSFFWASLTSIRFVAHLGIP
jgi:Protein of unknown function (DUF1360)